MITFVAIATFGATILGGWFALRFQDRLHLVLGFSAGAIISVAFFDLLPEAFELAGTQFEISFISSIVALGFLGYFFIDRTIVTHHHDHDGEGRNTLGAGSISIHSLLDGIAIGLAFQASAAVGLIVAAAVLAHNFSDGLNTVNVVLRSGNSFGRAVRWLFIDAIAPVVGIVLTFFFTLSESTLGILLAFSCGFFLYVGAADLLPESYHRHPTMWTTAATIFGVTLMYGIVKLAGI